MLLALIVVQLALLIVVAALLWRREATKNPYLAAFLAADLPMKIERLDARLTALDEAADRSAAALRTEVLGTIQALGRTLSEGLDGFRADNARGAEALRTAVKAQLDGLTQRFTSFASDSARQHGENRDALHARLNELGASQAALQEKLRGAVEDRLEKLNQSNTAKLEEMRQTVDEKLHATLQTRLTESFGVVTDQLTRVHAGLGEMTKLSAGVDDLSRIFTNVKSRGTIGEVMLETLLKQMLAPSQFVKNPKVKPGTQELVEFAVKLPTPNGEMLLPIDSKFPREIWERLETAYETGTDLASAGKAFETALRNEGRKICDKYIAPPVTTSFAIMFLPTEGLYAEVMRRDGLQTDIQQNCHVTIAGPSTLSAILNSFQMGFHMLQLQRKGDDVWKVLASARKEFGTFEQLMEKMSADVGRVQGTIDKLGVRTRAINRSLRDVSADSEETLPAPGASGFDRVVPMLAAEEDE
ncbi:MAG TPA: DNA recombination protein RmuC [Acidobacteriaceae bacterium]|jgi:DNA recombination protein RmuC|nr:DNA recombination protein RmuC [Acidobacteriaceae bacterium]